MHSSLDLSGSFVTGVVLIDTVKGTQYLELHANRSRKTGGQVDG